MCVCVCVNSVGGCVVCAVCVFHILYHTTGILEARLASSICS